MDYQAGFGMTITGFLNNFIGLAIAVMISGIGVAMFHPQSARLVALTSPKKKEAHYDDLLKRIDDARRFFLSCDEEVKELLKDPIEWKNYKELDYVFEMGDIF